MPFIRTTTNVSIEKEKIERIKSRYGSAISTMGKGENWLMLEFSDNANMYFGGSDEILAYVDVKTYGTPSNTNAMTGEITKILNEELGISPNRIYVSYMGTNDWGYNGNNF